MAKPVKKNRAVFLDRDGTIIMERNYLRKIKDVKLIKGAVEAMELLKNKGFKLVLVTNQSGIGRGYLTEAKLLQIHAYLERLLKSKGITLDAIYYCPHHPDKKCSCRKPNLGMVNRAKKDLNINLKKSFVIGDHTVDFRLGQNMGGKGVFVKSGHWKHEIEKIIASKGELKPDFIASNITAAAKWVAQN